MSFIKTATNRFLSNFGLQIVPTRPEQELKPWDKAFLNWIAEAETKGEDPNDIGDVAWDGNPLIGAEKYIFPYISENSVVIELGPGSGRVTRHIIPRCQRMILADYSQVVCDWLNKYLRGKGDFSIHKLDGPLLPGINDSVADMAFAYGVFEHIDFDDIYELLKEFHRVLKPDAVMWFNFDTITTSGGLEWFQQERTRLRPGFRTIFRFYHPDDIKRLAENAGFSIMALHIGEGRLASIHLKNIKSN